MNNEYLDVLILGAGVSGIGAACHLKMKCPQHSFAVLEGRDCIGGTWDLFRYPGVRSDSDMYTFGYSFHPWTDGKDIADGKDILNYVRETADLYGVSNRIRYQHKVTRCHWNSETCRWTVRGRKPDGSYFSLDCSYLISCTGYYDYAQGYLPEFGGYQDFKGVIAHPQHWPQDLDYRDKKVIVIGSGATAVTLVPNMAREAAHVTMLQRSPTYIFSRPAVNPLAVWINKRFPTKIAYSMNRLKNSLLAVLVFKLSKSAPELMRKFIYWRNSKALNGKVDIDQHFNPKYNPWDQRLCLIPDGDLFEALKSGKATVVTDQIAHFTEDGIALKSGQTLQADIIVPATGLKMQMMGGIRVDLDGKLLLPAEQLNYRGMMFDGVPNFTCVFGYTNASWTLKADLTSEYVCRLLNHMRRNGFKTAMPSSQYGRKHWEFVGMEREPIVGLSSGYIQRAMNELPKQGQLMPWRNHDNYIKDRISIKYGSLDDGVMVFR